MQQTKHTPGPLTADKMALKNAYNRWKCGISKNKNIVANAFGASQQEAQGNANLIAAAPELLAALKIIYNQPCTANEREAWIQNVKFICKEVIKQAESV